MSAKRLAFACYAFVGVWCFRDMMRMRVGAQHARFPRLVAFTRVVLAVAWPVLFALGAWELWRARRAWLGLFEKLAKAELALQRLASGEAMTSDNTGLTNPELTARLEFAQAALDAVRKVRE